MPPEGTLLRTFLSLSHRSIALLASLHVSEGKSPLENPRLDTGPTLPLPHPFSAKKGPLLSLSLQGCHAERGEELGPRLSLLRSRRRGVVAPCAARRLPATFALSSSAAAPLRCCLFRSEGKGDTVCVCVPALLWAYLWPPSYSLRPYVRRRASGARRGNTHRRKREA